MKNLPLASLLGLTLLAGAGCGDDTPGSEGGDGSSGPQETKWTTVLNQLPFSVTGDKPVNSLTIGRTDYNGNFANRGDVEVYFDQDAEVITIEMRFYDFSDDITAQGDPDATDEDARRGTLGRMELWAYSAGGSPKPPMNMKPEDDCTKGAWRSGCQIYTYYEGKAQPVRVGADIRVHLPKSYRGTLDIVTEDNVSEPSFPRLGNITVDGMCSSGDFRLEQGEAKVKLCRELTPAPKCAPADIKACEDFVDEMGMPAPWSTMCTQCPADNFGLLKIEAVKPWAGNITVDIPKTTWLNANLANEETDKPHDCKPVLDNCTPDVCKITSDDGSGYSTSGEFNYPGTSAASGAGFNLTVKSAGCNPVSFFPDAKSWSSDPAMSKVKIEEHGHIKVCTDCLP